MFELARYKDAKRYVVDGKHSSNAPFKEMRFS
jgi:hypothetical protein